MRDTTTKRGVLFSLILHVILLSLLFINSHAKCGGGQCTLDKKPKNSQSSKKEDVIPKGDESEKEEPQSIEVTLIQKPKPKSTKPNNAESFKDCPNDSWYGGIGIEQGATNTITKVFPGYPAWYSGLEVGDIIIDPYLKNIRGTPDTPVTITVMRKGEMLSFNLIRAKICIAKQAPTPVE